MSQQHDKEAIVRKVRQVVVRDVALFNSYLEKFYYWEPRRNDSLFIWSIISALFFLNAMREGGPSLVIGVVGSLVAPVIFFVAFGGYYALWKLMCTVTRISDDPFRSAWGVFCKNGKSINLLPLAVTQSDDIISVLYDSITNGTNHTEAHIKSLLVNEVISELQTRSQLEVSLQTASC